jgi:O-acetyl-ADP-ribose deacetylase (regulator of RNase III)
MIYEIDANLLEYPLDGIIHSANCFCTQSAGIALRIKNKFPDAYAADCKTKRGDQSKLGTFSLAVLPSNFHIYNMYGQFSFGGIRPTSYDAVVDGLTAVEKHARENGLKNLGLPKNMCSTLGGADWRIIRVIIETVFEKSPLDLYICNYEQS